MEDLKEIYRIYPENLVFYETERDKNVEQQFGVTDIRLSVAYTINACRYAWKLPALRLVRGEELNDLTFHHARLKASLHALFLFIVVNVIIGND